MKRITALFMVIVMCLSFAACNKKSADNSEKDTTQEHNTIEDTTVAEEKIETPDFFEAENIALDQFCMYAVPGTANLATYIGATNSFYSIFDMCSNTRINKDHSEGLVYYYKYKLDVAKYYGDNQEAQMYETDVNVSLGEHQLVTFSDYCLLAQVIKEVDGTGADYGGVDGYDKYREDVKSDAYELMNKYKEYKIVSCNIDFQWGAIDRMDLWEETGNIYGNVGFEFVDKYTGTSYSPDAGTEYIDQIMEFDGEEYNISLFTTGAAVYNNDVLSTKITICAVVPKDYDGAVFAIGDGTLGEDEAPDIQNHKESYLFKNESTHYHSYTAGDYDMMMTPDQVERCKDLTDKIFAQKTPEKDPAAAKTTTDLGDMKYEGFYSHKSYFDLGWQIVYDNATKNVYFQNNDVYKMSIFVTDSDYNLLAQTGIVSPGESLDGVYLADSYVDAETFERNTKYGVIYYDENDDILAVEWAAITIANGNGWN
ncbi:MAG: hypothetical protein IKU19_08475 [Clostridia bacterium]|nr:hypothetical protein [Clostridia bacterium]